MFSGVEPPAAGDPRRGGLGSHRGGGGGGRCGRSAGFPGCKRTQDTSIVLVIHKGEISSQVIHRKKSRTQHRNQNTHSEKTFLNFGV